MKIPNASYDKLIGLFPTMLNSEDPFSFLGLYVGLMLIVVKIKNNSFWFELSSQLKYLQKILFLGILVFTFVANYLILQLEFDLEQFGIQIKILLYILWFIVYAFTFGALQYLTYLIYLKKKD